MKCKLFIEYNFGFCDSLSMYMLYLMSSSLQVKGSEGFSGYLEISVVVAVSFIFI